MIYLMVYLLKQRLFADDTSLFSVTYNINTSARKRFK